MTTYIKMSDALFVSLFGYLPTPSSQEKHATIVRASDITPEQIRMIARAVRAARQLGEWVSASDLEEVRMWVGFIKFAQDNPTATWDQMSAHVRELMWPR